MMNPRVLFVSTSRWFATARLAIAMAENGCEITAICPDDHPLACISAGCRTHPYQFWAPERSIRAAIEQERPDFIVPADDTARLHLHGLHEAARLEGGSAAWIAALIEHSLGSPSSFSTATSRAQLIRVARELGIKAPVTSVVRSPLELREWIMRNGLPVILKSDGTYGGKGVEVASTPDDAMRALARLMAPPSPWRAAKRAVINQDSNYVLPCLRRRPSVVNAQAFVTGKDANVTAACWNGEVLGRIAVSVLRTTEPRGPASVVKIIENAEIDAAIQKLVRFLGVSGLVGFDFVLDALSGEPYLVEMNPRTTQTAHLCLGPDRDPSGALCSVLRSAPSSGAPSVTRDDVIAYFPQEWLRDPNSAYFADAYHDVPWTEPGLIRACLAQPLRIRVWTAAGSLIRAVRSVLIERGGVPASLR
jgi:hypothetical protein